MNSTEQVTDHKLTTVKGLLLALNAHLKAKVEAGHEELLIEEYGFSVNPAINSRLKEANPKIEKFRWLVAFAVEGGSEGYYVHVGRLIEDREDIYATDRQGEWEYRRYYDFGFCKTWSCTNAYAIAREAQRFLTAALWN